MRPSSSSMRSPPISRASFWISWATARLVRTVIAWAGIVLAIAASAAGSLSMRLGGGAVRVMSVFERDRKLLEYLHGLGIRPGAQLKVVGKNYDQTMTLRVDRKPVQLGGRGTRKYGWRRVEVNVMNWTATAAILLALGSLHRRVSVRTDYKVGWILTRPASMKRPCSTISFTPWECWQCRCSSARDLISESAGNWTGWLLLAGIVLFSGSLYVLAITESESLGADHALRRRFVYRSLGRTGGLRATVTKPH